jgi:hypothetical protein
MDAVDSVILAERGWSVQRWQDVARQLGLLVAQELVARMGPDEVVERMVQQVELALDPIAFRAAIEGG